MGEAGKEALRVGFEGTIKLEFHGAKVSSDAGLFPYRDIDQAAQLTETGAAELFDFRSGTNIQHSTIALLRQSVYSRLAGYEDTNDAERLSVDPVMRHVVGGRAVDRSAASTSQVARFETEVLTDPDNLAALIAMPGQWVDRPPTSPAQEADPRYGQLGQPDPRPAGRLDVQRALRLHVLSPVVRVQPGRRCGAGHAASWQRGQRR